MNNSYQVTVVAAVNDREILSNNLARSSDIVESRVEFRAEIGHASASQAYNNALDRVDGGIIAFAHQDVYLPRGSVDRLLRAIERLEQDDPNWGIVGVVGLDCERRAVGEVWDPRGRIGRQIDGYTRAIAMDELLLVVRAASGLRFDSCLPAFHLYAADMIQIAADRGMRSYVVDCPVIHNSPLRGDLGPTWTAAYRYIQKKWRDRLPLPTLIMPVGRTGWPLLRYRLRVLKRELIHGHASSSRDIDVVKIAQEIGYEPAGGSSAVDEIASAEQRRGRNA